MQNTPRGEVLFDEPDVEFPWNFCPVILGEHQIFGGKEWMT